MAGVSSAGGISLMSSTKHTAAMGGSMENPYTHAYQRDLGTARISDEGDRGRRNMDTAF
jgi:hypothetical protein